MGLAYTKGKMCYVQVNALGCDGAPLTGMGNSLVTCCTTGFEMEAITDDTDDKEGVCSTIPGSSQIKGYEVEWTLSESTDADLMVLLGSHEYVYDAMGAVVGISPICGAGKGRCSSHCGDEPCPFQGVAIHAWSEAWCGDSPHPDAPWVVTAMPKVRFNAGGQTIVLNRDVDFDAATQTLTGRTYANKGYGQGPGGIYPDPAGLLNCAADGFLTEVAPDMCGCATCDPAMTGFESGVLAVGG